MFQTMTGDVFAQKVHVLAHGVNEFGAMGAGIAPVFARRFPGLLEGYRGWIEMHKAVGESVRGSCYLHGAVLPNSPKPANYPWVANLFTQEGMQAKRDLIHDAMVHMRSQMERYRVTTVAFPAIGCGIAARGQFDVPRLQSLCREIFSPEVTDIAATLVLLP